MLKPTVVPSAAAFCLIHSSTTEHNEDRDSCHELLHTKINILIKVKMKQCAVLARTLETSKRVHSTNEGLACTVEYWLELQSLLWGCGSLRKVISEYFWFCSIYSGLLFKRERRECTRWRVDGIQSMLHNDHGVWRDIKALFLLLFLSSEHEPMTGCQNCTRWWPSASRGWFRINNGC